MASIGNDQGGKKRILFVAQDGKRKTIRLGKCSVRDAEQIKYRVENLLSAVIQGCEPARDDAQWLSRVSGSLRDKLVAAGLCRAIEEQASPTLKSWVDEYIASRIDIKPNTKRNMLLDAQNLCGFFGDGLLKDFTAQHAANFRLFLLKLQLSEATIRRRCKRAKQYFSAAVKLRIISENPFDDVPTANRTSTARQRFITHQEIQKVIDACPDAQWRLIFALARYGGLRIPSEIFGLTWENVLWDKQRFIVHSPKTEHIENKAFRTVPLFPELLPYFREVFELAPAGENRVITIYEPDSLNLRTQAQRIIKRSGLTPWPKIFQNLRSSRETELVEDFPIHVVTEWIGNSPEVAKKHYLQMTEEHFIRAAQNPAQHTVEASCKQSQGEKDQGKKNTVSSGNCETLRFFAKSCNSKNLRRIPPTGFEPVSQA